MAQDIAGRIVQAFLGWVASDEGDEARNSVGNRIMQPPIPAPRPAYPFAVLKHKPVSRDLAGGTQVIHKELLSLEIQHTDKEALGEIILAWTQGDEQEGLDELKLPGLDGWMRTEQQAPLVEATALRVETKTVWKATVGWIVWVAA